MLLCQAFDRLSSCKVQSIVRLPDDRGIEVAVSFDGRSSVRFQTTEFEVGVRGGKTAALARFAAAAGFGNAEEIYEFLVGLPGKMTGKLFVAVHTEAECVGPGSPNWVRGEVA